MTEIVAVTGAEGFIGSHLVERLVRRGQRVRAMVLYNSFDSRGWLDTLPAEVLAEVEVLPECGHVPQMECPQVVISRLTRFADARGF